MFLKETAPSSGNAALNFSWYSGIPAIFAAASASVALAISTGLSNGPPACSSTSAARPSQNWLPNKAAFRAVGELRPPNWLLWPALVGMLSTPAVAKLWQELQLTVLPLDRRFSYQSCWPSLTCSSVNGRTFCISAKSGKGLNVACARSNRALSSSETLAEF